ncbi:MAG TPA: methylenetetrahydrofolate reductase [Candidatus Angelobacter sp.]|nr:methylenetetrahydrofolate reductase [Candidatus Angelobacter sp.]
MTVELIPDRVIPAHIPILQGRVDAITIPALRNGEGDPSYPVGFRVTPQTRSLASAVIVRKTGAEAVSSLTCRDFRRSDLALIPRLFEKGLDNFLAVFGDPYPGYRIDDYDFRKTEDLIRGVLSAFDGQHPCVGAVTNQYAKDQERETSRTLRKVDAGASYIVTNAAFDDDLVLDHVDLLRGQGLKVPIFVQVSIPSGLKNLLFVSRKFGIPVPEKVRQKLSRNPFGGGIQIAADAYSALQNKVSGIHFSYLHRSHDPIPAYTHLLDAIETDGQLTVSIQQALRH